jgi:hypothetical protein
MRPHKYLTFVLVALHLTVRYVVDNATSQQVFGFMRALIT